MRWRRSKKSPTQVYSPGSSNSEHQIESSPNMDNECNVAVSNKLSSAHQRNPDTCTEQLPLLVRSIGSLDEKTSNRGHDNAQHSSHWLNSSGSLAELELRLLNLQRQMSSQEQPSNDSHNNHTHSSNTKLHPVSFRDSAMTLDAACADILQDIQSESEQQVLWFNLCSRIRRSKNSNTFAEGSSPKPKTLHRHSKSHVSAKSSNVESAKPDCPTEMSKLLSEFSKNCEPIAAFMERNEQSMVPFMKYTLDDAHTMPSKPGIVPVNDQTARCLPPLAAEEYANHISRISYFVRVLQVLETADSSYLTNPHTRLLIDLLLNLERTITLPRVDFLRRHAETIQAMSAAHAINNPGNIDTVYAVGSADDWANLENSRSLSRDLSAQHIAHMAQAIPRHPDFRNSTANTSQKGKRMGIIATFPDQSTCENSILGNRLQPEGGFRESGLIAAGDELSGLHFSKSDSAINNFKSVKDKNSEESNNINISILDMDVGEFTKTVASKQSESRVSLASTPELISEQFHPKLHPVVGPRSMEVLERSPVANSSATPYATFPKRLSPHRRSRRLHRRTAAPRTQQILPVL
ncbi:hypothetical protein BX070DRAFT_60203 [Coemansia spiralis]|nr:hypothetical protein BX070DRAFT_60203 [Coemansia spiralis]